MILWVALSLTAAYIAALFWVAHREDRSDALRQPDHRVALVHALSIGVYCTSWTFFGAVGSAAVSGWQFLPIYLGPILLFTLGYGLIRQTLRVAKAQHSTSIADFLAARYGKSPTVAATVTLIAAIGALPYMALQLKSVGDALTALAPGTMLTRLLPTDVLVLAVTVVMALFAILFGTRRAHISDQNRGLVAAIAIESLVKLLALVAMAGFALWLLFSTDRTALVAVASGGSFGTIFTLDQIDARFAILTLIAASAALCLPRQFHMTVVEAPHDAPRRPIRWVFPLYLLLISLTVIPVTMAGLTLLPGAMAAPDMIMMTLPLAEGAEALALFVFLGGISAATGMIIVSTVALSGMIANDLVLPVMLRSVRDSNMRASRIATAVQPLRRVIMLVLLVLAYGYYLVVEQGALLASLGTLSFALVTQFMPGLVGGLLWRGGKRQGMLAGLAGGFVAWAVLLLLPSLSGWSPPVSIHADPLVSGVVLATGLNVALYVAVSLLARDTVVDRAQAVAFATGPELPEAVAEQSQLRVADIRLLLRQFVGPERTHEALSAMRDAHGQFYADRDPADGPLVRMAERQIAGVLGSASAATLMQSVLDGEPLPPEEVLALLGETSQKLKFSGELLQIAIENIDQGVALVDREMRLVAWNERYVSMFDLPDDLSVVGRPIADLIRYNLEQNGVDGANITREVDKRIDYMRQGTRHFQEREQADGRILRIQGNPAPEGGYVTSYTDITADRRAEQALEAKVAERTQQLTEANAALEKATRSKTRFLAAASHDLVQPMNAARLFGSALREDLTARDDVGHGGTTDDPGGGKDALALLDQIDRSIGTAHRLLRALLDISRLDGGQMTAKLSTFALQDVLDELKAAYQAPAEAKGLKLRVMPCSLMVESDRGLLLSVLQNLLTNAIRYTDSGRIIVGVRRRAGGVAEIQVCDTGPGIAEAEQERIFEEFEQIARSDGEGLGLGLAIARRIAPMLGGQLSLESEPGSGSRFALHLEHKGEPQQDRGALAKTLRTSLKPAGTQAQHHILCVDNDPAARESLSALLTRWGHAVTTVGGRQEALKQPCPDILIMDYQLDNGLTGDVLVPELVSHWGYHPPVLLITAEDSAETAAAAHRIGSDRLLKPVPPIALRAWLSQQFANAAQAQCQAAE
ncbi:MAG: PAS domain-containing hybrid sensor histidine kinase/response regulator [Pseudomonadota bacterium]